MISDWLNDYQGQTRGEGRVLISICIRDRRKIGLKPCKNNSLSECVAFYLVIVKFNRPNEQILLKLKKVFKTSTQNNLETRLPLGWQRNITQLVYLTFPKCIISSYSISQKPRLLEISCNRIYMLFLILCYSSLEPFQTSFSVSQSQPRFFLEINLANLCSTMGCGYPLF